MNKLLHLVGYYYPTQPRLYKAQLGRNAQQNHLFLFNFSIFSLTLPDPLVWSL